MHDGINITTDPLTVATEYLVDLYGNNPQGLLWIGGHADGWKGRTFRSPSDAARYAIDLDGQGGIGVYHRSTTLARAPERRGEASDSRGVHYFALDIDVLGPGHKATNLPTGQEDAARLIEEAGFPEPSIWIASGGGFYPQWRFSEPIDVQDPEEFAWVADGFASISAHFIRVARDLGWHLDNVRDLARVFRMPGTTNRKAEPVLAGVLSGSGEKHDLGLLAARARPNRSSASSNVGTALEPDPFDNVKDERVFTKEQATEFVRQAGKTLEKTESGFNAAINNFAMACAHFPWLIDQDLCGRLMIRRLGQKTGWTAPDADDIATINSAYSATQAGRSWIATRVEAAADEPAPEGGEVGGEPEDRWTDAMLAGRLAREALNARAVFTSALGWLYWDGRRWAVTEDEVIAEITRKWVLKNYVIAVNAYRALASPDHKLADDPAVRGWASAQGASRIGSVVKLARGILIRDAAEFDQDPDLINTPSGVVDLRTGEVLPHDPARLITKITGAAYVPGAESAALKAALDAVPEDAREWLQRRLGEAATGHSGEQLLLLSGTGRNGKTLLMGAAFRALGGYAAKVPNTLLLRARQSGGATPEKMTLWGVRLAYMEETPEDGYLDATMVKDLLDAEEIEGRHLYKDIVSWAPTHSLFLNTNHAPTMGDTGDASWRRLSRLDFPFRYRKAGEEIESDRDRRGDPELKRALARGREGQEALLAWILSGARAWYEKGPEEDAPSSVEIAVQRWREESDDLLRFIAQEMVWDPDGWVARSDMYEAFAGWLRQGGQKALSVKTFGMRMGAHSILSRRLSESYVLREKVSRPETLLREGLFRPLAGRVHAYGGLIFRGTDDV